jgi:hypothetical protein
MQRMKPPSFSFQILMPIKHNGISFGGLPFQCVRFIHLFLLDKVRDDIAENKKLNYHLYMALKKALYKPGAFFKGFLFPLCQVLFPSQDEVDFISEH